MIGLKSLASQLALLSLRKVAAASTGKYVPSLVIATRQSAPNRMISTTAPLMYDRVRSPAQFARHGGANKVSDGLEEDPLAVLSVDTMDVEKYLPTMETMKQLFDGIPFEDLPIVHIKASKNNTTMTATDAKYEHVTYTSCTKEGFKNARKKTTIAGQTVGTACGQRLLRRGIRTVRVKVRGLGPGRMSAVKGLTVAGINIVSITDFTSLPELGPRPKRRRHI